MTKSLHAFYLLIYFVTYLFVYLFPGLSLLEIVFGGEELTL